jgi:hypothetical protein
MKKTNVTETMYKIVDKFNGYEDSRTFSTMESAERALEKAIKEFYEYNSENCMCHLSVVDSSWNWYHNGQRWVWGQ